MATPFRNKDINVRGAVGITTINAGCGAKIVGREGPIFLVDRVGAADGEPHCIVMQDIAANAYGEAWMIKDVVNIRSSAAFSAGATLHIADAAGRWSAAGADDHQVVLQAITAASGANQEALARAYRPLPWYSTEQTGTGVEVSIAHPLGRVPRKVRCAVTGTNGALASPDIAISLGTHTASLIRVTATDKVKFRIEAWV